MQKIFYISRNTDGGKELPAPNMNRFDRIKKLNALLECGWAIKDFKTEKDGEFFVLEKQ
ncbi:MAG: hypothetical protein IJ746_01550 [Ruminococcus sp.]|nr:hypothetical protein [Ruminococcus sp.]